MKSGVIYRILSSWWLTAGLLITLAATCLLFTLGQEPYARWVRFVFHTSIGLFLYLGLIVNLLMASIRVVLDRISVRSVTTDAVEAMDVRTEMPLSRNHDVQKIAAWMKGKGFSVTTRERMIDGVRGRYSFLPGTVMRAGFLVLLVSLLVSVHTRETLFQVFHEGERSTFFGSPLTVSAIEAELPQDFLQVGNDSCFLLEKAHVKVSSSGRTYTITPGFPTRINGNYFRLVHLGYAQSFTLHRNRRDIEKRIDLDILPPGKAHIVDVPGEDHFLSIAAEPDRTISKGLLKGKQYNLADPFYRVVLQSGREKSKPETFTVRPGGRRKARGLDLSLGKNSLYARLQIVRDPALAAVYLGSLLTLAGMLLMLSRFLWYRQEMKVLWIDSLVTIGYREEFFKKWGIQKFYRWKDELSALNRPESSGSRP